MLGRYTPRSRVISPESVDQIQHVSRLRGLRFAGAISGRLSVRPVRRKECGWRRLLAPFGSTLPVRRLANGSMRVGWMNGLELRDRHLVKAR